MRVLLINPFYPISETPSPPLGLAYLAAALEQAGVDVRVLDLVVYPYSDKMLAELLEEFKPALVGLTAVTMNVDHALSVARDVKRLAPQVVTVLGGLHVTFSASETLEACPDLDIAALGEGSGPSLSQRGHRGGRRPAGLKDRLSQRRYPPFSLPARLHPEPGHPAHACPPVAAAAVTAPWACPSA
jgi:radical SAM superfamily enzyme YgiQ (UPF0313 family)